MAYSNFLGKKIIERSSETSYKALVSTANLNLKVSVEPTPITKEAADQCRIQKRNGRNYFHASERFVDDQDFIVPKSWWLEYEQQIFCEEKGPSSCL